jgi:Carboxypeptidase regulatory-like domain
MKKKTGISLLLLTAAFAFLAPAAKKKPDAYVLLYGTVFRETGFALPNAEVIVVSDRSSDSAAPKMKKMEAVSNGRGEFAFHLPTGNARYIVKVSAKGYRSEEKPVTVQGEDRIDVTFQLDPESK